MRFHRLTRESGSTNGAAWLIGVEIENPVNFAAAVFYGKKFRCEPSFIDQPKQFTTVLLFRQFGSFMQIFYGRRSSL